MLFDLICVVAVIVYGKYLLAKMDKLILKLEEEDKRGA